MKNLSKISLMVLAGMLSTGGLRAQDAPAPTPPPSAPPKNWNNGGLGGALSHSRNKAQKAAAKETDPAKLAAMAEESKQKHLVGIMDFTFGHDSGEVLFELLPQDAPQTVENFRANADKNVYNGMAVHRAIKDYLLQMGDPASKDDNAREKWGLSEDSTIPAEIKLPHVVGSIAMARRGDKVNPDRKSDGTQFYFVLGNMSAMDGQDTVFGQVVSGLDVLRRIARSVTDANDCPVQRVEIKRLVVVEQRGPITALVTTTSHGKKHITKPEALKGPMERFLERIW
jgi:peptidyl-prolyl cis-trans isomerase B (cyclophilin B)